MKAMTTTQFYLFIKSIINELPKRGLITEPYLTGMFNACADEYFKDPGISPWELCRENPCWKEERSKGLVPHKGYKV